MPQIECPYPYHLCHNQSAIHFIQIEAAEPDMQPVVDRDDTHSAQEINAPAPSRVTLMNGDAAEVDDPVQDRIGKGWQATVFRARAMGPSNVWNWNI